MRWLVRRFRRGISTGAALTLLVLSSSLDGAAAAPPPQAAARVACGETITKNTALVADVGPCPGDGIIIGADNITLNLNGHTISGTAGPGDGNAAGVRLANRTGVTLTGLPGQSGKQGTITGFDAGVFINRGSGNTIENLTIVDNVGPANLEALPLLGDGVVLFYSANNRIVNNLVARNGHYDGIGIFGEGSNDNLIRGNTVEDTVGFFDRFNPSLQGNGIVITHFLNANDPRGEPIFNNDVIDNVVRRNFTAGISTIANHNGRIIGNTIEDNGDLERNQSNGIGVSTGDVVFFPSIADTRMLIEDNKVNRNGQVGIFVRRGASGNQILRNEFNGNKAARVIVGPGTPNNVIAENTALGNLFLDLFDFSAFRNQDCQGNVWRDNTYGTAAPECAANGTQVDSTQPATGDSSSQQKANPSTGAPPPGLERLEQHSELPPRAKAPRE
jgi:parallel beta-helix repeat protein